MDALHRPLELDLDGARALLARITHCHRYLALFLDRTERLLDDTAVAGTRHGADADLASLWRYFDVQAQRHHHEEDTLLAPLLRSAACGASWAAELESALTQIAHEHHLLDFGWPAARQAMQALSRGAGSTDDRARVHAFCTDYRAHLALEDRTLVRWAQRVLNEGSAAFQPLSAARHTRPQPVLQA
jgi:hemerythrin-like domain-containing protein